MADGVVLACAAILFGYFVLLKRSKAGTLGYLVCDVRVVGLDGRPASFLSLILRTMFAVLGLLSFLDLLWLCGEPHRQALRDKFAQTYVVRRSAQPLGTGRIAHHYYEICGYHFLFPEIEAAPGS
jgi:uncharacterized RDD family membrane protein YckC